MCRAQAFRCMPTRSAVLRQGQTRTRIAFAGDIEVSQFRTSKGDGRRLLGRRQRHEGVPPHLIELRRPSSTSPACSGCSHPPGRLQRGEVRGAGFTEALRQMELAGHGQVTTVHPGGIKTNIVRNMTAVETWKGPADAYLRQEARQHLPGEGGAHHPRRRPQEQGPRARRPRRQGAGPHRPRDRLGIPAAVLDGDVADGTRSTLSSAAAHRTNAANLCA